MFNINLLSFSVTDEEVGNLGERWGCFRGDKMTKSYGGFLSGPRFMDDYRMVTLWLWLTKSYWKWPSRNSGFTHWKWWFSIVNLYVYQRVLENALWTYGWSLGVALFSEPPQHPVSAKLLRTELLHWWWLVVDLPLWKILVSWDDDIPNIWKNMIDVLEDSHFFEWSCRFEGNLPRCFWSTFRWSVPRGSWKLRWWMAGRPIGWN